MQILIASIIGNVLGHLMWQCMCKLAERGKDETD